MEVSLEFSRRDDAERAFIVPAERQAYHARESGGGTRVAVMDWSELQADLAAMDRVGTAPAVMQRLGDRLRSFLLQVGWERHEQAILNAIDAGQQVQISIKSSAAELYQLPWELVSLGPRRQHLHEYPTILLRYAWPNTHTTPIERPRPEGGRILIAWSAALGAVPSGAHVDAIGAACADSDHSFDRERDVLRDASLGALQRALAPCTTNGAASDTDNDIAQPVAILHLLCHGGRQDDSFVLGLDRSNDAASGAELVDAARLRRVLAPHARHLRLVVLSVCSAGHPGSPGNHLGSIAQNLHCAGFQAVIASRAPLSKSASIRLCQSFYGPLLRTPVSVETALRAARSQLATDVASPDWASLQLYARAEDGWDTRPIAIRPYRGLLPFTARYARFFRGRDAEHREIRSKLDGLRTAGAPRFLLVAGASGRGKSSLVLGGVVPALVRAGWRVGEMRPGMQPTRALDELLRDGLDVDSSSAVLVIDQLEELFTHVASHDERRAFIRRVWSLCARADGGLHAIATMRVDFLGDCGELSVDGGRTLEHIAYDDAHATFVAHIARTDLRTCIVAPARMVGVRFQDGLVQRILDDVEEEPGPLPLVQYALDLLWRRRVDGVLTMDAYNELGGVGGAPQIRADALIDGLTDNQRRQARRLLVRLVNVHDGHSRDTHRRMLLTELEPHTDEDRADLAAIVAQLVEARLVVRSLLDGQPALEIAHEALIRKWPRLREWLDEDRDQLAEIHELERWEKQWRELGALLEGARLGYALRVREKYAQDLGAGVLALIVASEGRMRTLATRRRRRITATVSLAVLSSVIIGVLGVSAYHQAGRAKAANARANAALVSAADMSLNVIVEIESGLQDRGDTATIRRTLLTKAQQLHDTLLSASPDHPELLRSKMMAHKRSGDLARSYDNSQRAYAEYQAAFHIARQLVDRSPNGRQELALVVHAMGDITLAMGDLDSAQSYFQVGLNIRTALALQYPEDGAIERDLALSFTRLGQVILAKGDLSKARAYFSVGLKLRRTLVKQQPDNPALLRDLSASYDHQGDIARKSGDVVSARQHFERALSIREHLADDDPRNTTLHREMAISHGYLGDITLAEGDLASASQHFGQGLQIHKELVEQDEDNGEILRELSISHDRLGDVALAQGDNARARRLFVEGLAIRRRRLNHDMGNANVRRDVAISCDRLGAMALTDGDLDSASRYFTEALELRTTLANQDRNNATVHRELSVSYDRLADVAVARGQLASAHTLLAQGLNIHKRLSAQDPQNAEWRRDMSVSYDQLGDIAVAQGDLAGARSLFETGLGIRKELFAQDPHNARWQHDLTVSYDRLGNTAFTEGDLVDARSFFEEGLAIRQQLCQQAPDNVTWLVELARSHQEMASLAWKAGNVEQIQAHVDSGLAIVDRLSASNQRQTSTALDRLRRDFEDLAAAAKVR